MRPHPVRAFVALPATVARLLTGSPGGLPLGPARAASVVLVLLDGFGLRARERFAGHPFLRRLEAEGVVAPLTAQFPSTTAAHVTTLHTGLPVGAHGLYEWHVLEPETGEIVLPLLAARAGAPPGSLPRERLARLVPPPTLYERLARAGVRATLHQPASFSPSPFDAVATRGAQLAPFRHLEEGLAALGAGLRAEGAGAYRYLYFDGIDAVGHEHGPESAAAARVVEATLDALHAAFAAPAPPGTVLLVTADHGQIAVDPARVDLVDREWPPLRALVRTAVPAGSARDLFLHVDPAAVPRVVAELGARLEGRAEVHATAELVAAGLFGEVGPRLRARLAEVCVLPAPGRMAWWSGAPSRQVGFRGHHGGLTAAEAETWVGVLGLG